MNNLKKPTLIFLIVLFQTLAAISAGFIVLYISGSGKVSPATFVESVDIGNMTGSQADEELKTKFSDWADKLKLSINVEGEKENFEINLKDIEASVDSQATVGQIAGEKVPKSFYKVINGYFLAKKTVFKPSITFNEQKLKEKVKAIAAAIYKEPVNARIYVKDGKITKFPGANGKRLVVDNAVSKIKSELMKGYKESIAFSFSNKFELEEVYPQARTEDLNGVDDIISTYSTEIKAAENLDSIKKAVAAINRVLIYSIDPVTGERAGDFSFNKYLNEENLIKEYNDEGYNQVASTLHAAVLEAGIEPKDITRVQHKSTVDYIEAGLDVRVYGNSEDFKFKNSLDNNIVVFAEIKDNKIIVNIAGKASKKKMSS